MGEPVQDMTVAKQRGLVPVKKKGIRVREAMRTVVGDLENVLGELKTVVGDLQVLVNQIDEVTNKIDEEYGPEFRRGSDEHTKRSSLSVEAGVCKNGFRIQSRQYRDYQAQNIVFTQSQWLCLRSDYTVLARNIVTDYSPTEVITNVEGHCVRSSDTSGCVLSSKENSPESDRVTSDRPRCLSSQCFVKRSRAHLGVFSPMDLTSPESPFEFPLTLPSPNSPLTPNLPDVPGCPGHALGPLTPGQPQPPDYCGVYERELDMQLEHALEEDLDNKNYLDRRDVLHNQTIDEYQASCRDRVNMWAAYTVRDVNVNPIGWLCDPFVNSPSAEHASQDMLNDNMAHSNLPSPDFQPLWAGSLGGSSDMS